MLSARSAAGSDCKRFPFAFGRNKHFMRRVAVFMRAFQRPSGMPALRMYLTTAGGKAANLIRESASTGNAYDATMSQGNVLSRLHSFRQSRMEPLEGAVWAIERLS